MITPDRLRMRRFLCPVAALACCLAVLPSRAQSRSSDKQLRKDYALIFGTVWDRENLPVYGAIVKIRRASEKKPRWELISDRSGEFAQRVPTGAADYVVWVDDTRKVVNPRVARRKLKPGQAETKVHIENDERSDIGLH
ncbi:MAG: hypothetical protein LAO06_10985 [Acidobacteriia bacterium]|nr:hypothetical protein [Terriglobia bacterium]